MGPGADSHSLNARLLRFRSDPDLEDACALAEDLISARRYGDARGVAVSAQTDDERLDSRLLVLEARAWYLDHDLVRAQAALVAAASAAGLRFSHARAAPDSWPTWRRRDPPAE